MDKGIREDEGTLEEGIIDMGIYWNTRESCISLIARLEIRIKAAVMPCNRIFYIGILIL